MASPDVDDVVQWHVSERRRAARSGTFRPLALVGAMCCVALMATTQTNGRAGADQGVVRLDEPGTALRTAERVALRPPPVPDGKLMFPVSPARDCYVLDNFGDTRGTERLHEGLDIMGSAGQPVYAVASGVLTKRYTNTGTAGWGWTLYNASTKTTYKYYHLAEDAVGLVEGSAVKVGATIGYVGNSGTSGEANFHLHFEVRPNNVAIDPLPLLVIDRKACGVSGPIRS